MPHTFNQRRPCDTSEGRGANENFVLLLEGVMKTKLKNQNESFLGSWARMGKTCRLEDPEWGMIWKLKILLRKSSFFLNGAESAGRSLLVLLPFNWWQWKWWLSLNAMGADEMKKKTISLFIKSCVCEWNVCSFWMVDAEWDDRDRVWSIRHVSFCMFPKLVSAVRRNFQRICNCLLFFPKVGHWFLFFK